LGSAVASTAVFGVPPETLPSLEPVPSGVGSIPARLAGETPARATETVALPNPTASFQLRWVRNIQGSTRAPRVVAGALAGHIFESPTFPIEFGNAIGEGACAPRSEAVRSLREDQGASNGRLGAQIWF